MYANGSYTEAYVKNYVVTQETNLGAIIVKTDYLKMSRQSDPWLWTTKMVIGLKESSYVDRLLLDLFGTHQQVRMSKPYQWFFWGQS